MNTDQQPIASSSTAATESAIPMAASKAGRSAGKAHKSAKAPVRRSYISSAIKTPFEKRREADKKKEAVKGVEKDMKEELQAEKDRKVAVIKERRERQAEKKRMEEMAAKMSAKKLQRMRKRQGRSAKING